MRSMSPLALGSFVALLAAACSEPPTAHSPDTHAGEPDLAGLDLVLPGLTRETLVTSETVRHAPPEGLRTTEIGEDPPEEAARIIGPETRAGFSTGYAYALGRHDYVGNKGRVETTAQVTYKDQQLGSQRAWKEQDEPFLLDFGQVKSIWANAKVYTDQECGLGVYGSSVHSAWWEFYQGTGVSTWGHAERTSQAAPQSLPRCGEYTSASDPTGAYDMEGGDFTCYFLITFDVDTGVIYDVTLLSCGTISV